MISARSDRTGQQNKDLLRPAAIKLLDDQSNIFK